MTTGRPVLLLSVLVALILALPVVARAQDTTLNGTVADSTGGVLPGVTITALNEASGTTFQAVTDQLGLFRLPVRPGTYRITVELSGFAAINRTVELLVGQAVAITLQMRPSNLQESITVTGEAPLIDTTSSSIGTNVDPRQLSELPVNGRNFMDLTMLSPGSRQNNVGETPAGDFQLNIDGQQVTQGISRGFGQPRYSRDAIAEFEFKSSRFDATQGRSSGVQVNVVTKSGTNTPAGSLSGYFRNDKFNAADFIQQRVLPYSDQQMTVTFGGPIVKDKIHYFAHYEYEREPQTYAYSTPYPAFNLNFTAPRIDHKGGVRLDFQFSPKTHLYVRANKYNSNIPYDPRYTGGATKHPSSAIGVIRQDTDAFATLTQVLSNRLVNEIKGGYTGFFWDQHSVVNWPNHPAKNVGISQGTPVITLRGITIGQGHTQTPIHNGQDPYSIRDDLTYSFNGHGRHDVTLGGEYIWDVLWINFCNSCMGILDAQGGAAPANLPSLFPVWNDVSTWNLAALSPIARSYRLGIGNFRTYVPQKTTGAWLQDDWKIASRLTLNLGVRYDFLTNTYAQGITLRPFLEAGRPNDMNNLAPRLGFSYSLNDKTVIRGGAGTYYTEPDGTSNLWTAEWAQQLLPTILYDGRADFASNPFNGPIPTFDQVATTLCTVAPTRPNCLRRAITSSLASPSSDIPYSYQSSIGFQRQLSPVMAVEADYVFIGSRGQIVSRDLNLAYNPATGVNYTFTDLAHLPYPDWGQVITQMKDGESNYHSLQMAFTKRMSNKWQASVSYSLSRAYQRDPAPINPGCTGPMTAARTCDTPFKLAEDLDSDYYLTGEQQNRAVVNGIWELPYALQLSGLYFFGDNGSNTATSGVDVRQTGASGGRLKTDGALIARNNINRANLHRVDLRIQRRFALVGRAKIDGMLELFNVFNHANYGTYVTNLTNAKYGQPTDDTGTAYRPRMLQLGFRATF